MTSLSPASVFYDVIIVGNGTASKHLVHKLVHGLFLGSRILVIDRGYARSSDHIPYPDNTEAVYGQASRISQVDTPHGIMRQHRAGGMHLYGDAVIVSPTLREVRVWDIDVDYMQLLSKFGTCIVSHISTILPETRDFEFQFTNAASQSFALRCDHPWPGSAREISMLKTRSSSSSSSLEISRAGRLSSPSRQLPDRESEISLTSDVYNYRKIEYQRWCTFANGAQHPDLYGARTFPLMIATRDNANKQNDTDDTDDTDELDTTIVDSDAVYEYRDIHDDPCSVKARDNINIVHGQTHTGVTYMYNTKVDQMISNVMQISDWRIQTKMSIEALQQLHPHTSAQLSSASASASAFDDTRPPRSVRRPKIFTTSGVVMDLTTHKFDEWCRSEFRMTERGITTSFNNVHVTDPSDPAGALYPEEIIDHAHPEHETSDAYRASGLADAPKFKITGVNVFITGDAVKVATTKYHICDVKTTINGTASGTIYARHGVILCTGAVDTPGLLTRSGIGKSKDHSDLLELGAYTVPMGALIVNNPNVGTNIRDVPCINLSLTLSSRATGTATLFQENTPPGPVVHITAPESGMSDEFANRLGVAQREASSASSASEQNHTLHTDGDALQSRNNGRDLFSRTAAAEKVVGCKPYYSITVYAKRKPAFSVSEPVDTTAPAMRTMPFGATRVSDDPEAAKRNDAYRANVVSGIIDDTASMLIMFNPWHRKQKGGLVQGVVSICPAAPASVGDVKCTKLRLNHLSDTRDIYAMLDAYYRAIDTVTTLAKDKSGQWAGLKLERIHGLPPTIEKIHGDFVPDDSVRDILLQRVQSTGAITGGACIGPSPHTSCVSPTGRVWGVENLFVASAALLPTSESRFITGPMLALVDHLAPSIVAYINKSHARSLGEEVVE